MPALRAGSRDHRRCFESGLPAGARQRPRADRLLSWNRRIAMAAEPTPAPQDPPPEKPAPEAAGSGMLGKLGEKLLELLALGLPTVVIEGFYKALADPFLSQPWQALWIIAPLAAVAWIAWQAARRHADLKLLRGPVLVFFVAYVAIFSL